MDKVFLEEYSSREKEEIEKFVKRLYAGEFGPDDSYPPTSRFIETKGPVTYACQDQGNLSDAGIIWPQIPFASSLRIGLVPSRRPEHFKMFHGFDIRDIPRLADFAKETGKVQFILVADPKHYAGLDHFDPIFVELNPPLASRIPPESMFSSRDESYRHKIEFRQVAECRFAAMFENILGVFGWGYSQARDIFREIMGTYLLLRALGKDELAEKILNSLLDDPPFAFVLLSVYGRFVTRPILYPVNANYNTDIQFVVKYSRYLEKEDQTRLLSEMKFPCEVGRFLMKKLTPCPQSFNAMQIIVDRYKHEDLYRLMEDLEEAIAASSGELVLEKATGLEEILDSVWSDAKRIKNQIKTVDFGLSCTFGLLGPVVGYASTNVAGLLASLGLSVAVTTTDFFGGLGVRILRKLRPGYLVNIYDFQNKHAIE